MNIQIIKRDGSKELFEPEKISRVVIAAGLDPQDAQKIITYVETELKDKNITETTSLNIRDLVVTALETVSKSAHDMFVWYQSTKSATPNAPRAGAPQSS